MFISCLPKPNEVDPNYQGYSGNLSGSYTLSNFTIDSTIDPALTGLHTRYCYDTGISNMPIVVIMHGWSGDATQFNDDTYRRLASYGYFVLGVSMRQSTNRDASGRELHDIIDAVEYVKTNFSALVNQSRKAIVGYSGGGGNVLATVAKFPDYFNIYVDHFGMSDYGFEADGWYQTDPSFSTEIATRIGGIPADKPNEYKSRNIRDAVNNFGLLAPLLIFHDTEDASVDVIHSQEVDSAIINSKKEYRESTTSDSQRWTHGFPTNGSHISESEEFWKDRVFSSVEVDVPDQATIIVKGYIITKKFSIWLGNGTASEDGKNRSATVTYDVTTDTYTVTPLLEIGATDCTVKITQGDKTANQTISVETSIIVENPPM